MNPSDPKANPDVLHVDGPTRDAIIEAVRDEAQRRAGYGWLGKEAKVHGFSQAAEFIESRFSVSAEPLREDDERFTIYYCPKCGRHKCDPGDMVIHSRDCGGTYGPIEVVRVSAEPSPDALREALEHIRREGKVCDQFEICEHRACQSSYAAWAIADRALATDQSQSDRTSDEATPAEPTCEHGYHVAGGTYSCSACVPDERERR